VFAAELPLFFASAVGAVCVLDIDAVAKKALIQKLAANFK
jgi:hypothetical protein